MKVVCYYHANCRDGLGAAAAINKKYPEAVLYAMGYNELPPVHQDTDIVFVVDFSFPIETTESIIAHTKKYVWIDHHEIDHLVGPILSASLAGKYGKTGVHILYDKKVSGAYGTWRFILNGDDSKIPPLVRYISDYDLWKFELPNSRAVTMAMGSIPRTVEAYCELLHLDEAAQESLIKEFADKGNAIIEFQSEVVESIIATTMRMVTLAGKQVPMVNCPYVLVSSTLERLYRDYPVSVGYFEGADTRTYSIRSSKDSGIDVCEIAKQFGGGGHKHAAGWRTPVTEPLLT